MKWLDLNAFLGISAIEWSYAIAAALVTYLALSWVLRLVVARLAAIAERTQGLVKMQSGIRGSCGIPNHARSFDISLFFPFFGRM